MMNAMKILFMAGCMFPMLPCWAEKADTLSADVSETDWKDSTAIGFVVDQPAGICDVSVEALVTVCSLSGRVVARDAKWGELWRKLPKGIYLIGRKKYLLR